MQPLRTLLVLVLLSAHCLQAQTPPAKLLTFDIAAIDAKGALVSDLRASDFRVTDAGRRQEIAYFRRGRDNAAPAAALSREYTNGAYGVFPHVTVVLLDQLNAKVELTGTEWQEIARGLTRAEGDPGFYFYLLTKTGSLFPVHGLPDSWLEPSARFSASEVLPLFEDMRKEFHGRPEDLDTWNKPAGSPDFSLVMRRKQLYTETALQRLAARLATVPGPKSIVWIGQRASPLNRTPSRQIDPTRGLRADWGEAPEPFPIYYVPAAESAAFKEDPAQPQVLARHVDEIIALALADSQRGYRLGYYPPASSWDGKRHDLRIVCMRPGVTARAQAWYTAVRPVDVEDDRRQGIPDLVSLSPFDAATLRFRAVQVPGSAAPAFDLRVNAEDVLFEPASGAFTCSLAAQALHCRDGEAPDVLQDAALVNLKFTAAERQAALRDGIPIHLAVAALNGASSYRIVVLDRATHSFGTLTVPAGSQHP